MCRVSVIVPVYRTERYLRRCIDSLLAQTLDDLEVILVDDGSPDGSGMICDAYAAEDARVRVIHKANGGSASARNAGLAVARGDYIGFVDSDDWVSPRLYQVLLGLCEGNQADIAICRFSSSIVGSANNNARVRILPRSAFMPLLLSDSITSHLWNKLFQADLWRGITMPTGVVEDMLVAPSVFSRASTVIETTEELYFYYLSRPDNLSNDPGRRAENAYRRGVAFRARYEMAKDSYPDVCGTTLRSAVRFFASAFGWMAQAGGYEAEQEEIIHYFASNRREIFRPGSFDVKSAIGAGMILGAPKLYVWVYRIFRRWDALG